MTNFLLARSKFWERKFFSIETVNVWNKEYLLKANKRACVNLK